MERRFWLEFFREVQNPAAHRAMLKLGDWSDGMKLTEEMFHMIREELKRKTITEKSGETL